MRRYLFPQRGITLFELFTVLSILSLILLIATPAFYEWYQHYRVKTTVSQIAVHLRFARAAAVKQKLRYQVVFDAPSQYVVEYDRGTGFEPVPGYSQNLLPSLIELQADATVTFDLRGSANATTLNLQGPFQKEYHIEVAPTGAVTTTESSGG